MFSGTFSSHPSTPLLLRTSSHCEHSRPAYSQNFRVRKFTYDGDRHRRPACASVKQSPLKESSLNERSYFLRRAGRLRDDLSFLMKSDFFGFATQGDRSFVLTSVGRCAHASFILPFDSASQGIEQICHAERSRSMTMSNETSDLIPTLNNRPQLRSDCHVYSIETFICFFAQSVSNFYQFKSTIFFTATKSLVFILYRYKPDATVSPDSFLPSQCS